MNKNKVLIVAFSLLLLIGLTACQGQSAAPGGESVKTGDNTSSVATPSSSTSNASVSVNPATSPDGSSASSNASATIVPADGKSVPSTQPSSAEPPAEIKELLKMQDQLSAIVKEGDISKCKDLGMTQYVMSCEINVMLSSAKSKDDTAVCDKASTKDIKDQCLMLLKNMPAKK